MNKDVKNKTTTVIGENLDALITIDWRGQGHIRPLYQAARRQAPGPLTMDAARRCVDRIKEGDVVFIMTGFPVGPFDELKDGKVVKEHSFTSDLLAPETDGVVGAALLARAVDLGFGAKPVVFSDQECVDVVRSCCAAAGLHVVDDPATGTALEHSVTVRAFTKDPDKAIRQASRILDEMVPVAAVSIERPGRNEKGRYHMANGRSIDEFVAKLDELFEGVARSGGLTIGIGDLGNELGMGALKEATRELIFYGQGCRCGCGGGIGAAFKAEATIVGAISDDATYALLACLAYLLGKPELLHSTEMELRVLQAACDAGAIDGPTGRRIPWIDNVDAKTHNHMIELMRDIVASPRRFYDIQPFFYGELISK